MVLKSFKSKSPRRVFDKMKEKVKSYYTEQDQIQFTDQDLSDIH